MNTPVEAWQEDCEQQKHVAEDEDVDLIPFSGPGDDGKAPVMREGKTYLHYPKELKFQVVMDALRGKLTQVEIGMRYGVPQSLVSIWKKAAIQSIREGIGYRGRVHRPHRPRGSAGVEAVGELEEAGSLVQISTMLRDAVELLERVRSAKEEEVSAATN
jgi:transposase-like protein